MAKYTQFDFSNKDLYNHIYIPLLRDNNRVKILYGGRNSGKSDFIAQQIIINLLGEKFYRIVLVRKFYNSIETSQFQTIKDYIKLWKLEDCFHISTRPLKIVSKINPNNIVYAKGLDKEDNTKSMKDVNAVWFEEANQIHEDAYVMTSQSLRGTYARKIEEWVSFNPVREKCFINQHFFPNRKSYEKDDGIFSFVISTRPDTTILHTTYKDNRFLPNSIIENLESYKNIDENYYRVNTLGLWGGALKGLIYEDWEIINSMPEGGDDVFGLDYGYVNPTALVHCRYHEKCLFVNELLYQSHLTHNNVVEILKKEFWELLHKKIIIVDSAAPELIAELKKAGFYAKPAIKGQNSVSVGINAVNELKMFVTSNSDNIISELETYTWKEARAGSLIDEPVKLNDHACDAIRYAVQTYGKQYWDRDKSIIHNIPIRRQKKNRNKFMINYGI